MSEAIGHTIDYDYAHHIERLIVLGLFCPLLGVRPYDAHRGTLSMFWDAIDCVSLPNVLGMSQGGLIGTKPYAASGNYFTTLYWDFLARHKTRFAGNRRMTYPYLNLARKERGELAAIRRRADWLKA